MMKEKLIGGIGGFIVIILIISPSGGIIINACCLTRPSKVFYTHKLMQDEYPKTSLSETILDLDEGVRARPYEFMIPKNSNLKPPKPSIRSSAPSSKKNVIKVGTIKMAVLLVCFANLSFDSTHNPAYYTNLIFNHSNPKSVASYYWENSYGQLNVTGDIIGGTWYRSSHSSNYWGEDSSPGSVFPHVDDKNGYIYNLVIEGVQLADPTVDFRNYDNDSDSVIDYLLVVHAGDAQEGTGVSTDIWSHRWSVQTTSIVDNVVVKDYTMCAETSPMGTFAHELGHAIGDLPDLYDTDYSSDGIGRWGIMGAGAWNYNVTPGSGEGPGDTPSHFCAWSKIQMGWLKPTIVTSHQLGVTLPAIETSYKNSVLKFFLSDSSNSITLNEYFLVCFRNQTGFDSALPGSGILIWHIDECNKYEGNDGERRKLVDLEEADANADPNGVWEQLDYVNQTAPPWATLLDDNGNITDPWTVGNQFNYLSIPDSDSNDGMMTNVSITVNSANIIDILIAHDPFPWDYTLLLMDKTALNIEDDEPSIVEHGCSSFSLAWQSNRTTGDWDIYGSQTGDAGLTWSPEILIANSTYEDYSPSLIYWYPPTYWVRYIPDIEDKPIPPGQTGLVTQPPLHYIVAFVSERTGNPEIFITISPDFISWSVPVQITNNSASDLDPCLIQTPRGDLGLFWASNRTGNFEIFFIEEPWNKSNIVQITNNGVTDRGPSYYCSENNTHLLAFEHELDPNSSIQLITSTSLNSWPFWSRTCSNPSVNSIEPSLIEREDGTLLIAFTELSASGEEIHQIISSNWINWSSHLIMNFPKNASSPSLVETKCGALFMAYSMYNATQISHVYLIHTTLCYHFGVGIDYPQDTGDSFFNPTRVEQNSAWTFTGEMHLNQSDVTVPANNVSLIVTDTRNTWNLDDDEILFEEQLEPGNPPPPFEITLDPGSGTGWFSIPLNELNWIYPEELPTGTILRFRIEWWYKNINEQWRNINGSIYVELLLHQDHIQFEGNVPKATTKNDPLEIQEPIIQGFVSYGVESVTFSLYDADAIPPVAESPLQSQITRKIDKTLDTVITPYSQQTFVFTDVVKASGVWTIYLQDLKDNITTKIVATSNGIFPRKATELYLNKSPWDTNAPQLNARGPTRAEGWPVVFSEEIIDNQGGFNYGIDESTITFSYKVLSGENKWTDVTYSDNDLDWSKIGNMYNYTLQGKGKQSILYYWSVSDLAYPSNLASDGSQENPYCISIYSIETQTITTTTTIYDTTTIFIEPIPTSSEGTSSQITSTSRPGERTIGFELFMLVVTLSMIIIFYRRRKHL